MGATFIAGSLACVVAAKPAAPTTQARPQQRQVNISKLYEDTCAKCHGSAAQGGGGGTQSINTKDKFDEKWDKPFFDAIKKGLPNAGMDAYGPTMTDEEIWGLVVHMRELQLKALREEFGGPKPVDGVYSSQYHKYKVETVVDTGKGLRLPWAIGFYKDGKALVTNRSGFMFVLDKGKLSERVEGLPAVVENGQGGLMDAIPHPTNGWVYLAISEGKKAGDSRACLTKIVRGKLDLNSIPPKWSGQETIWEADQKFYLNVGAHFGGKIVFDGKGHLFFAVGERGQGNPALDPTYPWGKIYRLNEDGSVPSDNPKFSQPGAIKGIYTMGHRNPQGLTIDLDGNVWDTEHGPRGGDELNLLKAGASYGWPKVAFSLNYNDSAPWQPWNRNGDTFTLPVHRWTPSIAASGLDVVRGTAFPKWRGDLLAGGLAGNTVQRIRARKGKMVELEEIIFKLGRVRDVRVGPDGFIYIILNDPDKIVRLVPAG